MILDKRDLNLSIASSKSVGEIARKSPLPLENGCFPDDNEEMMEVDFCMLVCFALLSIFGIAKVFPARL